MDKHINVESMIASRTMEPAVMLRLGEEYVDMPAAKARQIGMWLIEAAESAEQDAFLIKFLQGTAGWTLERAASVVRALREERKKEEEQDGPETSA